MKNNYNSNSIMIKELPRSFVDKYGDMKVVTPKGNSTTLREAYTKYGNTPVLRNNVPHLTDFLLTQELNDIATAREVELNQQHRSNQEFNRQMDNFLGFNWVFPNQIGGAALRNLPFINLIYTGGNGFFNDLLLGTNGIVTDKFASEHPFLSTVANIAFDFSPAYPHIVKSVLTKGINLTNRAIHNYDIKQLVNEINKVKPAQLYEFLNTGQIGWAPRQTLTGYHASNKPIQKFNYWYPNWAVTEHNAPHGVYFTANETRPSGGFLAKRPYIEQVTSTFNKPMVLVGEISTAGKNATRNLIERQAQSMGADGIIYQGIKDNQLKNQTIVKTLNPDLKVNVSEIIENDQTPFDSHLLGFVSNSSAQQNNVSELMDRFINQDIIPRLQAQGYQITSYKPNIREISPKTDLMDAQMINRNAGAWFTPTVNDVTIRGSLLNQDYGLLLHEVGGHGIRYTLLPDYRPTTRYYLNLYIVGNGNNPEIAKELLLVHIGTQPYTLIETKALQEGYYPYVSTYFKLNPTKDPNKILNESGAVNTLFRAKISLRNNHIVGKDLDKAIDLTQGGLILKMLDEQPYTHRGFINYVLKLTGKDPDDLLFLSESDWEQLIKQYPELTNISERVKTAMKTVGVSTGLGYGLYQFNQPTSNRKGGKLIRKSINNK